MKQKDETFGERVRRIRGNMHQGEFGKQLGEGLGKKTGVGQGTISAWERNDKDRPPSAEMCIRLAQLASRPEDRIFFLGKSGLSSQIILSASEMIQGERTMPPVEGEIIRIPRLFQGPKGEEQQSPLLALSARAVHNPNSTEYYEIDMTGQMGGVREGDTVILDTSKLPLSSPFPLLKHRVLMRLAKPEGMLDVDWPGAEIDPYLGYYVGTLRVKLDTSFELLRPNLKNWVIAVEPWDKYGAIFDPRNEHDRFMGMMRLTKADLKRIGPAKTLAELPPKEFEIAQYPFDLDDGWSIMGEVVGILHSADWAKKLDGRHGN